MTKKQFESEDRERREMPWRKHAPPINKSTNSDNPNNKGPINHSEWNQQATTYPKKGEMDEEINGLPEVGDVIRTKKMQMQGKVESVGKNKAGYDEILFRLEDGRLMKTPLSNVIVVQKLADCNMVMEVNEEDRQELDEISNEVLSKYKTSAGKEASASNEKAWDTNTPRGEADAAMAHGNRRFAGIVKATKKQFTNDANKKTEGTMSGINRWGPSNDVSYEKILDEVKQLWEKEKIDELSVDKLHAYKNMAGSQEIARHAPLRKIVKHVQGSQRADQKIKTKTGDRTGMKQPGQGTIE